jgi:hypothetical protein
VIDRPPDPAQEEEDDLSAVAIDLAKLLTASTLDYLKGITQGLQSLTGLLLTSYIALFVAFGKQYGFFSLSPLVTGLPVALFCGSLLLMLVQALLYPGGNFVFGNPVSTLSAYAAAVDVRKRQLIGPSVLTMLGIVSFAIVIVAAV